MANDKARVRARQPSGISVDSAVQPGTFESYVHIGLDDLDFALPSAVAREIGMQMIEAAAAAESNAAMFRHMIAEEGAEEGVVMARAFLSVIARARDHAKLNSYKPGDAPEAGTDG